MSVVGNYLFFSVVLLVTRNAVGDEIDRSCKAVRKPLIKFERQPQISDFRKIDLIGLKLSEIPGGLVLILMDKKSKVTSLTLPCTVSGPNKINYAWMYERNISRSSSDSVALPKTPIANISGGLKRGGELRISPVNQSIEGTYQCVVDTEYGYAMSRMIRLKISSPIPQIEAHRSTIRTHMGDYLVLSGRGQLSDELYYSHWSADNISGEVRVGEGDGALIVVDDRQRLHVKSFLWDLSADTNNSVTFKQYYLEYGSEKQHLAAEYTVFAKSRSKQSSGGREKRGILAKRMAAAYLPSSLSAASGEQLRLTCVFIGSPIPVVTLWKSEDEQNCPEYVPVNTSVADNYLIFNSVTTNDSGLYCCQGQQEGEKLRWKIYVHVDESSMEASNMEDLLVKRGPNTPASEEVGKLYCPQVNQVKTDDFEGEIVLADANFGSKQASSVCQRIQYGRYEARISNYVVKVVDSANVSITQLPSANSSITLKCNATGDSDMPFALAWIMHHESTKYLINKSENFSSAGFTTATNYSPAEVLGNVIRQSSTMTVSVSSQYHTSGEDSSVRVNYRCSVTNGCNSACTQWHMEGANTIVGKCDIKATTVDRLLLWLASASRKLASRNITTQSPPEFLLEPVFAHFNISATVGVALYDLDHAVLMVPTSINGTVTFSIPCLAYSYPRNVQYDWLITKRNRNLTVSFNWTKHGLESSGGGELRITTTADALYQYEGQYQCLAKNMRGAALSQSVFLTMSNASEQCFDVAPFNYQRTNVLYSIEGTGILYSRTYPLRYSSIIFYENGMVIDHKSSTLIRAGNIYDEPLHFNQDILEYWYVFLFNLTIAWKPGGRVMQEIIKSNKYCRGSFVATTKVTVISRTNITVKPSDNLNVTRGRVVKFQCDAVGDDALPLRIEWSTVAHGCVTPIFPSRTQSGPFFRIVRNPPANDSAANAVSETLIIFTSSLDSETFKSLSGLYVCNATNDVSYSIASALLRVRNENSTLAEPEAFLFLQDLVRRLGESLRGHMEHTMHTKMAPQFLIEPTVENLNLMKFGENVKTFRDSWIQVVTPDDQELLQSELELPCYAYANPSKIHYNWYFNGVSVRGSSLFEWTQGDDLLERNSILKVKLFKSSFHGTYQCCAKGKHGKALSVMLSLTPHFITIACEFCAHFLTWYNPIKSKYAVERDEATLNCSTLSDYYNKINFSRLLIRENMEEVEEGDIRENVVLSRSRMEILFENSTLYVNAFSYTTYDTSELENLGNVHCVVESAWYPPLVSSAAITVIRPTQIIRKPYDLHKIHFGTQVEFRCDAIGVDILDLRFRWLRTQLNSEIEISPERTYWNVPWRIYVRRNDAVQDQLGMRSISETLVIRTGMFKDQDFGKLAGKYTCEATNDASTDRAWAWLSFYAEINFELLETPPKSPSGPVFISEPSKALTILDEAAIKPLISSPKRPTAYFGFTESRVANSFLLGCCAKSNPPEKTYHWYVNGTLFENPNRVLRWRVKGNDNKCGDLTLARLTSGTFQCVVSTTNGSAISNSISISMFSAGALADEITVEVKNGSLYLPLLLNSHHWLVEWSLNTDQRTKSFNLHESEAITFDENGALHMSLASMNKSFIELYLGKFPHNDTVILAGSLHVSSTMPLSIFYRVYLSQLFEDAQPGATFTYVTPGPVSVIEGETGRFVCVWNGYLIKFKKQLLDGRLASCHGAKVEKQKDDVPFVASTGALHNAYVIVNATLEDAGTYICEAHDREGEIRDSRSIEVSVETYPRFESLPPREIIVPVGQGVTIVCAAVSVPAPSVFFLENRNNFSSRSSATVDLIGGTFGKNYSVAIQYTISQVQYGESRVVQCVAENKHNRIIANTAIVVVQQPQITRRPQNYVHVPQRSFIELRCDATGDRLFSPFSLIWKFKAFNSSTYTEVVAQLHRETGLWFSEFRGVYSNQIQYDFQSRSLYMRPFLLRNDELKDISGAYMCIVSGTGKFSKGSEVRAQAYVSFQNGKEASSVTSSVACNLPLYLLLHAITQVFLRY